MNDNGRQLNLGWWTHSTIYRWWCIVELYTRNLYNFTCQCHCNTFKLKNKTKTQTIRSTIQVVETLNPSNTGSWNTILCNKREYANWPWRQNDWWIGHYEVHWPSFGLFPQPAGPNHLMAVGTGPMSGWSLPPSHQAPITQWWMGLGVGGDRVWGWLQAVGEDGPDCKPGLGTILAHNFYDPGL